MDESAYTFNDVMASATPVGTNAPTPPCAEETTAPADAAGDGDLDVADADADIS